MNLSSEEQFNATLTDGEAEGEVSFPDTESTVDLSVELDGEGRPNATFSVDVVDTSSGSGDLTQVPASQLDYNQDGATVEIGYAPDVGEASNVTARLVANLTNEPEVTRDVTVRIDGDAPTLDVQIDGEAVAGTATVGPDSVVSTSASDDLTGVTSLSIVGFRDGERLQSRSAGSGSAQATIQELGIEDEGQANVLVVAEDAAGNEDRTNITVTVDTTGPSLGEPSVEASGSSLVVTVDASDDNGVEGVRLFFRGPDATTFRDQAMSTNAQGAWEARIDNPGSSGGLEYYIQASDQVGNDASEGSRNTPLVFNLDSVDLSNAPPSIEITAPADGSTVSGNVDVTFTADDEDGDPVTVDAVTLEGASTGLDVGPDLVGTELDTPAEQSFSMDSTRLADGTATLTVTVSDGEATREASVSLEVDNETETDCAETVDLDETDEVTFEDMGESVLCVQVDTVANATSVRLQVSDGGQTIVDETRSVSPDEVYEVPTLADGNYDITVTQLEETDEGGEREVSTSSASVSLSPPKPFGRFLTTLALGAAVVATAGYAAFGRWS